MKHAAAMAISIIDAAGALGLEVVGHRARCFNAAAHKGGEDTHPSLNLNPESNCFKCFSCGVTGDSIELVKAILGVDFRQAVRWIESRATQSSCVPPARPTSSNNRTPDDAAQEVYLALYENSYRIYPDSPAGKYLHGRGLDLELVNQHFVTEIGNPWELWDHLIRQFGEERLQSAGLLSRNRGFLFACHALLFFYVDNDHAVYVQARDITSKAQCKELSLAGLTSPVPFNTKVLTDRRELVCICEGCIDTLSALQLGCPAVGIPGVTGFRSDWFDRFRYVGRVVLLLDNDEAGRRQAVELRSQFRIRGIVADAYHPRGVKDVNDLLKTLKGS